MNDSHAGALATGAFTPGQAGILIGTTAVLLDDVDHLAVDLDHEVLSMPSPVTGRYLVWAENGVAGKAVDHVLEHVVFAQDELGDHRAGERFAALDDLLAATPPGAGGVLFLPWLAGSLSPRADRRMRGAFLNLSLDTSRRDLVRSMVEGTAHNLAWLLPVAERFAGHRAEQPVFGGGAARSRPWAQILADVLDRPVAPLFDPDHAVARAVALAALHGADACAEAAAPVVRTATPLEPAPANRATYDRLTAELIAAHEALAPICARLHGTP